MIPTSLVKKEVLLLMGRKIHTLRVEDDLWDLIPKPKSDFIRKAVVEALQLRDFSDLTQSQNIDSPTSVSWLFDLLVRHATIGMTVEDIVAEAQDEFNNGHRLSDGEIDIICLRLENMVRAGQVQRSPRDPGRHFPVTS